MASNQKLVVSIVGENRSFIQSLEQSKVAAKQFSSSVNKALSSGSTVSVRDSFGPLLKDVRGLRGEADDLGARLDNLGKGMEGAGRGAGLLGGSLAGVVARAGAFGFAVNAAYQASARLQEALTTTGRAAFTTEGRLKNLGASLLGGDVIGAFEALRRQPKTLDELGISITQASNRMDALQKVADGTAQKMLEQARNADNSKEAYARYQKVVDEAGTSNQKLARELVQQVSALKAAENAQNSLADATSRLGTVFRDVTGQAVTFKGAVDDIAGPRGPGLVDQINAALELAKRGQQGAPAPKPIGPSARNANALLVAQANGDLDEVIRLQKVEQARLAKAIENSHGNVKQREQLARDYAAATAAVVSTAKQIEAQNKAEAQAAATAAKQARSDRWAKIIGALDIGVTRAQLTATLADDIVRLEALKSGLQKQIRAGVDVASAQAKLAQVEITIARTQAQRTANQRAAAQAAEQARQFRGLGLSGSGDEIVPGAGNLAKRLEAALSQVDSGQRKLSSKLVAHLRAAQNLVKKEGGKLTEETRKQINEFLKAASGEDKLNGGPFTKGSAFQLNKFLEGLKVDPALLKQLEQRFTRFSPLGLGSIPVPAKPPATSEATFEGTFVVELDGNVIGQSTKRFLQNDRRHNAPSRR